MDKNKIVVDGKTFIYEGKFTDEVKEVIDCFIEDLKGSVDEDCDTFFISLEE